MAVIYKTSWSSAALLTGSSKELVHT